MASLLNVIRSIYGKEIVENLIEINEECKYCKIQWIYWQ